MFGPLFTEEEMKYFKEMNEKRKQDIDSHTTFLISNKGKTIAIYKKDNLKIKRSGNSKEEAKGKIELEILKIITSPFRANIDSSI